MIRRTLICTCFLLLTSCHLFEKTPQSVVDGQRGVYQGILLAEENDQKMINAYLRDTKAAVVYHVNFVFEPKINAIREDPDLSREEKSLQIAALERLRQAEIDEAFVNIEKNANEMLTMSKKNLDVVKKLVESIYNYLSTTPIEVDNLQFWIEKLKQISEQDNGQ